MKKEIEKYIENRIEINKFAIHICKIFIPIVITLIFIGLGLFIFGMYMALTV